MNSELQRDSKPKGTYYFTLKQDGNVVHTQSAKNMITTDGMAGMLDYLCHRTDGFVEYIGLGLINTAAALTDIDLYHETTRKIVEVSEPHPSDSSILYHITLSPSEAVGVFEEIGAFSDDKTENDRLISNFDLVQDAWSVGVTDTVLYKEGENALKVTANGTATTTLTRDLDLSTLSSNDTINLLIYPVTIANLTSITLRFLTDASNYWTTTWAGNTFTASQWNLKSVYSDEFTATGTPDWENLTSVSIICITTASIAITFDSLRAQAVNDTTLFSRTVISPPLTKTSKQELLVVYKLAIT